MSVRLGQHRWRTARRVRSSLCAILLLSGCDLELPPDYYSEPHLHGYSFGENVRFGLGGDSHRFKQHGWSYSERGYTWTEGIGASLIFRVPRTHRELTLAMRLKPFLHPPAVAGQPVHLSINGRKVATWHVDQEKVYKAVIPHDFVAAPPDAIPGRPNLRDAVVLTLDFLIPNAQFPALLNGGSEWRRLGVACSELRIREGKEHSAPTQVPNAADDGEEIPFALGTAVRFGAGANAERYKRNGWHTAEGGFTWTGQQPAVLGMKLEPTGRPLTLTLVAHGNILPPRLLAQPTAVYANNRKIAEWQVDVTAEYTAEIPADVIGPDGVLTLKFVSRQATSPEALGVSVDSRVLGIACFELLLAEAEE